MSPEELEALMGGELEPDALAAFAALVRGAAAGRESRELSEALIQDPRYLAEPLEEGRSAAPQRRVLAASSQAPTFPARYSAGRWAVTLWLVVTGDVVASLDEGGGQLWITVGGSEVMLTHGEDAPLPSVESPPPLLRARLADGRSSLLVLTE